MSHARRLNKASNTLFFTALILAKLRVLPVVLFASISYVASLFISLTGYLLWIISSHLYPDQKALDNRWYGFSQVKHQNKAAGVIGAIAIIFCIAATIVPTLLIPGFWLLLASNVFWCISHYHKLKNPPKYDNEFSSSRQKAYIKYAMTMTAMSVLNALAATIVVIFPLLAPVVFTFSIAFSCILSLIAFNFWVDCNITPHQPDSILNISSSFATISSQTGFGNRLSCHKEATGELSPTKKAIKQETIHHQEVQPDDESLIITNSYQP